MSDEPARSRLRVEGVTREFPARSRDGEPVLALAGIDLDLAPGEFVSVVGPSGCGKSTLLDVIAGLDPPTSGTISLDGDPGTGLLGRVGYMPQSDLLMPWRTVLDNAALGPVVAGEPRSRARELARSELDRFGLAGFEDAWPVQVSGGMRQRAALLRTFLSGGEPVLLDEPFAALDALTREGMREWLLDIWESEGRTILFVTHDVEEAVFLSDRVLVMSPRPGRIELSVEVDLPRPRHLAETPSLERFTEIRDRLASALRSPAPSGAP